MQKKCLDSYYTTFTEFGTMLNYHQSQSAHSKWERMEVKNLYAAPFDKTSPLYGDLSLFAPDVSEDAVKDTAVNLGLAIKLENHYYPVRNTAFKSLADRAKIGGSALPKLKKPDLVRILTQTMQTFL